MEEVPHPPLPVVRTSRRWYFEREGLHELIIYLQRRRSAFKVMRGEAVRLGMGNERHDLYLQPIHGFNFFMARMTCKGASQSIVSTVIIVLDGVSVARSYNLCMRSWGTSSEKFRVPGPSCPLRRRGLAKASASAASSLCEANC